MMRHALIWCSIAFAAVAAVLCWISALGRLPATITSGFGGGGGTVQQLGDTLRRQSRWVAAAATAAGLSAALQAVATALPSP